MRGAIEGGGRRRALAGGAEQRRRGWGGSRTVGVGVGVGWDLNRPSRRLGLLHLTGFVLLTRHRSFFRLGEWRLI